MVYLDWKLTLFTFCTFPVVLFFMDFFGKKIRKSGHRIQQATADITSILQETLAATRVVKSFVREPYEIARFDQQNKANFYANMKSAKLMGTLSPVIEFIAALGVTAIIGLAAVPSSAVTLRRGPLWLSSSMPSIFPIRSSGLPAYWEASKRRLPRLNVSFTSWT